MIDSPRKRRKARAVAALLSVAAASLSQRSIAAPCGDALYQSCFDANTFAPYGLRRSFVAVSDASWAPSGQLALTALGTYGRRPLVLARTGFGAASIVDHLTLVDLGVGFAPIAGASVEASVPLTLYQDGVANPLRDSATPLRAPSVRDPRVGLAVSILPLVGSTLPHDERPAPTLVARAGTRLPATAPGAFESDGQLVPYLDLAFAYTRGRWTAGASAGTHLRTQAASFGGFRRASDLEAAVGAGFAVFDAETLTLSVEARTRYELVPSRSILLTASGVESRPADAAPFLLEGLAGVRVVPARSLAITAGFGLPVLTGSSRFVPEFRAVLALATSFRIGGDAMPASGAPAGGESARPAPAQGDPLAATPAASPPALAAPAPKSSEAAPSLAPASGELDPAFNEPPPPPPKPKKATKKKPKKTPKKPAPKAPREGREL